MRKKRKILITTSILFLLIFSIIFPILMKNSITGFATYHAQPSSEGNDTYIRENIESNYGSETTFRVGKTVLGEEFKGLLKFNVSSIGSENTITNAIIQLYLSSSNNDNNITIKAYRITSDWEESESTWNNRTSTQLWTTAGGDYIGETSSTIFTNKTGYFNITITPLIRGWVNGTYQNYGIMLISDDATNGDFKEISSSDSATTNQHPEIIIEYFTNAAPTINTILSNSSTDSPIETNQNITFSINWTDIENNPSQIYICNSSNITFDNGCEDRSFCETLPAQTNPATCSYTISDQDDTITSFWVKVCDATNCSTISSENFFYINHPPINSLIQPNGGETVNQSLGNYSILFNVSDADSDNLTANIYYGAEQNTTTNIIASNINLKNYCTGINTSTTNNCTYSWNSLGIYGTYFLTIIINDSQTTTIDSSNSNFNIRSIIDTEAPQITFTTIDSRITSGKETTINATITDDNMDTAWISLNYTSTNNTMTNITPTLYNTSFIAPAVGTYKFKIYANDSVENTNNSLTWEEFTVTKPNATPQNENSPSTALPYHIIKISTELNATDPLKTVYAYLNVPSGFTFLENYPQNTLLGNFSANEIKNATWFISTPITESTYILNVTYADEYSNSWNSSNFETTTTSSIGGYEISMAGYPEVETSYSYNVEGYFKQNGIYTSPDSIEISIYDSTNSLIIGPTTMTSTSTGIYNYTYSVPASPNEGIWETIINATKSGTSYFTHQFWKVVGGPFDVRDIKIDNSNIENLTISLTTENTGGANKDIILVWNLTRVDNNAQLDSGSETFMVPSNSEKNWTINPSTTYVGQTKITFMGYYSGTEKAGAFKIFSTTTNGTTTHPQTPNGGGGGGGGGSVTKEQILNLTILNLTKTIDLTKNIKKTITIKIKNTGTKDLTNISLNFQNMEESYYTINPKTISKLKPGKTQEFEVHLTINDFIGEKETAYIIKTNELILTEPLTINVMSLRNYYLNEIKKLKNHIFNLNTTLQEEKEKSLAKELLKCEKIIPLLESNIEKEEFINAENNLELANECVNKIEDNIKKLKALPFTEIKMTGYWVWIITWTLILILIIILITIIYLITKKFNIIQFMQQKQTTPKQQEGTEKRTLINERLKNIKEKLGN